VSLRIYIAYGTASDQVTALRLQALGAVNGLTIYVPPAFTREDPSGQPDPQSELRIWEAEIVLGVVTVGLSEACWRELDIGKRLGKKTMVIAEPVFAAQLEPSFPGSVLMMNSANPAEAEAGLVQFLENANLKQDTAKALLALGTIALGLLLFSPQD
jgi:hypothetical protein